MSIINLEKNQNLDNVLGENQDNLVVLFFGADWSEESKLMSDVAKELVKENGEAKLRIIAIEAEDFQDVSIKYGVEIVPTFVFLKEKNVLYKLNGANPVELRNKLNHYIQNLTFIPSNAKAERPQEDLNTRLKNLINSAPVILFMKGTPSEPRCGFSRQIIEILKNQNVKFSFFDILSDNEVREGLKKYSDWPTYPQLYSKGQLVGGLDIVKELVESGEFASVMPKEESFDERLKSLINKSKVMLFMKGNAAEPKCGFSRQIVEILNKTGEKYETFDILTDNDVREGLKKFSNWPTYPQLYVDGELVGGLDIVKELVQNEELGITLKGKSS